MTRFLAILLVVVTGLSACTTGGFSNKGGVRIYQPSTRNPSKVQFEVLDSVNALRQASGLVAVQLNAELNAAAATHSRDMSVQNRPWHFGSDGSSPIDRARRVGYAGRLAGENISETYETELETLGAWMQEEGTRSVVLDPDARDMGFAWFQEPNGKLWWTMVMGVPTATPLATAEFVSAE